MQMIVELESGTDGEPLADRVSPIQQPQLLSVPEGAESQEPTGAVLEKTIRSDR